MVSDGKSNSIIENFGDIFIYFIVPNYRTTCNIPKPTVKNLIHNMPSKTAKKVGFWASVTGAITGGLMAAASATITLLGFTKAGILAGSTAAAIHAGIGNVAVGSSFAAIQGAAASGVIASLGIAGGVILGTVVLGLVGYGLYRWL